MCGAGSKRCQALPNPPKSLPLKPKPLGRNSIDPQTPNLKESCYVGKWKADSDVTDCSITTSACPCNPHERPPELRMGSGLLWLPSVLGFGAQGFRLEVSESEIESTGLELPGLGMTSLGFWPALQYINPKSQRLLMLATVAARQPASPRTSSNCSLVAGPKLRVSNLYAPEEYFKPPCYYPIISIVVPFWGLPCRILHIQLVIPQKGSIIKTIGQPNKDFRPQQSEKLRISHPDPLLGPRSFTL